MSPAYWFDDSPTFSEAYHEKTEEQNEVHANADRQRIEAQGFVFDRTQGSPRGRFFGPEMVVRYVRVHVSTYRGVSREDCLAQAQAELDATRQRGYHLTAQTWGEANGLTTLTLSYRYGSPEAGTHVAVAPAARAPEPPAKRRESPAHQLLNALVGLWTLGYLAVIVLPVASSNGNSGIGAVVGFGAAAILFIPWVIVLVILVVLRSTTRAR